MLKNRSQVKHADRAYSSSRRHYLVFVPHISGMPEDDCSTVSGSRGPPRVCNGWKLAAPTLPGERPDWAKLEHSGRCKSQGKMTNSYRCTQLKCGRMDTPRNLQAGAFAGTAEAYFRYRPPYPKALL